MRQHTVEVSPKTSAITLLRFRSPEGALLGERELKPAEVLHFAAEIERKYRVVSVDSATLVNLGRDLFQWLDGPTHRWLAGTLEGPGGMLLRIDVADGLRHLPWELLYRDSYLCLNELRPFTPARLVSSEQGATPLNNRPLRLLFMACSPEGVLPVLDYEGEEGMILEAARRHQIEVFAEESGSLGGLQYQVESFGAGHFDVLHLTGHADVHDQQPRFVMEDDRGFRQDVAAEELAAAFQGNWPRLVFLSGCKTGEAPDQGSLPSLCEALVRAGAPAVLGWALPVGDVAASLAAAELYQHLAAGKRIDEAVARARHELLEQRNPFWHLMRLYVNATPLTPVVTTVRTSGRAQLQTRAAANEFIDQGAKVEVCSREAFVGRRRLIQRCLRTLQSREGEEHYAPGVLLHGMGGLGKSSLAVRLCERIPGHQRMVFVGAFMDEALDFTGRISNALADAEAIAILNQPLTLNQRLRKLLTGPLATRGVLFVFDDFEQNLELVDQGHIARPVALGILRALLTAIRESNSASRVIVTCRYQFALPSPLHEEALESLRGAELNKKLNRLSAFSTTSAIDPAIKHRAIELGGGNPRLLEWLNRILADGTADAQAILEAMARENERFRENVLLRELFGQLPMECRRLIALAATYELPVERDAIAAAVDVPLDPHLQRVVALGLIEGGIDPGGGAARYYVSRIVASVTEPAITAQDALEAARRAAEYLYRARWQAGSVSSTDEALEIFRLAMLAHEREIAAHVASRIANHWVNSNRYREAELLCYQTLALGQDHRLLHTLARAQVVLGRTTEASQNYDAAWSLCPDADFKAKSHILFSLATLVAQQGDVNRALELWQQSLEVYEQIGDVQGKAATLSNMAGVIAQQGDVKRALELWQQALQLLEQIGDVHGKAATLNEMAGVIAQQGDVKRALELWQQSLQLREQIGDVRGKAVTHANMAGVIAKQGNTKRALELWQQSLQLMEQIGDVRGKAATLQNMAGVIAEQGDVKRALDLWQQALQLLEQIGDVEGKAATLHEMAGVIAQQGNVKRALELWQQSLQLREQIGDVQGRAVTLANMAWAAGQQGDHDTEARLNLEAAGHLATVHAWLDLITVLGNLGASRTAESLPFMAQSVWLVMRVEAPARQALDLIAQILGKLGMVHEIAPHLCAAALLIAHTRGQHDPEQKSLIQTALNMLGACAEARKVEPDQIQHWFTSQGLNDPGRFLPELFAGLEGIVGETWVFDRRLLDAHQP